MENTGDLLGQLLPASTNPYHDSLRTEDTTETQFRVLITDPVFAALIFPSIGDGFDVDINVHGELVHHYPNRNIELVLGIRDVRFSRFSSSVLAWGCWTVVEWEGLARTASPARTGYSRLAEVRT